RCPSSTRVGSPPHAVRGAACSARAKEKLRGHGAASGRRFIALRWAVASSSDCPPERNTIPGTAAGTVRRRHRTVACATSSTGARRPDTAPGNTMLGFRSMPSSATLCSHRAWKTVCSVASVTSKHRSIECPPSIRTSGSTIGTISASWHNAAYRASASALASRANGVGFLANGLVEQDHPADELADALGRQEHLPVAPAVLLIVHDPERLEAPTNRGVALIRGEDPLTGRNQSPCRTFQSRRRHHPYLLPAPPEYRVTPVPPNLEDMLGPGRMALRSSQASRWTTCMSTPPSARG